MYVNMPELQELPEPERTRELERILREIIFKHNREMDEMREALKNGGNKETHDGKI